EGRALGGYIQSSSGLASFTAYSGCGSPACGEPGNGFTAAMNQLAYGAPPGQGSGDACGRCFSITGTGDPYSPWSTGPFNTIVVKVTDLCPAEGDGRWCEQTTSNPTNQYGKPFHFDICEDTGGADAFFPSGLGALIGNFTEVSCNQWSGSNGGALWNGACLAGETAGNWPAIGCGNEGT
ncbi:glycoside hydrolase family 45 protein, partial [Hebeloma cylindrosporum]